MGNKLVLERQQAGKHRPRERMRGNLESQLRWFLTGFSFQGGIACVKRGEEEKWGKVASWGWD